MSLHMTDVTLLDEEVAVRHHTPIVFDEELAVHLARELSVSRDCGWWQLHTGCPKKKVGFVFWAHVEGLNGLKSKSGR